MAAAANKNKYAYAPSRVYSYSRAALAETLPEYEPARRPQEAPPRPATKTKTHPGTSTRVKREPSPVVKRKQRFLPKLFSVAAVFMAAAVLIYIIVRYAAITTEWAAVNETQAEIDESLRRITQLEVQLDEATDLHLARETALEAGMGYPSADQIVDVESAYGGGG